LYEKLELFVFIELESVRCRDCKIYRFVMWFEYVAQPCKLTQKIAKPTSKIKDFGVKPSRSRSKFFFGNFFTIIQMEKKSSYRKGI